MTLATEDEISRLETWQRVLEKEGKTLAAAQARALAIWRQTSKTLQLLAEFEAPFVELVNETRAARRKQLATAAPPQTKAEKVTPPPDEPAPQDEPTAEPD